MTLTITAPASAPANSGLAKARNYIVELAGDPRVVGIWRLNDPYVTLVSSAPDSFVNMKSGGVALAAAGSGYRASMAFDPMFGRNTLRLSKSAAMLYRAPFNRASFPGFTMFAAFRPESYDFDFALRLDTNTNAAILRLNLTGAPQKPLVQAVLDTTIAVRQVSAVRNPYAVQQMAYSQSADTVALDMLGEASVSAAVTDLRTTSGNLDVGSTATNTMPNASYDMVALFNVNLNAPENWDLKRLFRQFLIEVYGGAY